MTNFNPALAHMDVAQDKLATYAMLLNRAQSSLKASLQAFERANKSLITGDCPSRKQITHKQLQQYAALTLLTDAIVGTITAPTLSRMIATAPKQSPQLLALLDFLPEAERELLEVALTSLFIQGRGEVVFLSKKQVELAENILAAGK